MSAAVYKVIPFLLEDGSQQYQFLLKLNAATQSFRIESSKIKRSIFFGRRTFNKLFQFLRNEYGIPLGKIHYDDNHMNTGSAFTSDNQQFRFSIKQADTIYVILENQNNPLKKITATLTGNLSDTKELSKFTALIPSILAAMIYTKEEVAVA
jgi:hypothetical protein